MGAYPIFTPMSESFFEHTCIIYTIVSRAFQRRGLGCLREKPFAKRTCELLKLPLLIGYETGILRTGSMETMIVMINHSRETYNQFFLRWDKAVFLLAHVTIHERYLFVPDVPKIFLFQRCRQETFKWAMQRKAEGTGSGSLPNPEVHPFFPIHGQKWVFLSLWDPSHHFFQYEIVI